MNFNKVKKRSVLNSPRLSEIKRKKRNAQRKKIIIIIIIFLIIFFGLAFASRIEKFNIKEIKISGNKIIETKDIEEIVQKNIEGNYLWLFPKTNFLIYPQNKIELELFNKFKRFENISFNISKIRTLEVLVSEREAKYTWCGTIIPILDSNLSDNKCYFIDNNGYIFDEAPYFSNGVYFTFYGQTENNSENPSGTYFIPNYFKQIISLKENLEIMNLNPTTFFQLGGENHFGEGFISLSSEPTMGPYITFKLDSDYKKLSENLKAAIEKEPLKTDLKEKFDSLLYIDLKFGNKIYYKFK